MPICGIALSQNRRLLEPRLALVSPMRTEGAPGLNTSTACEKLVEHERLGLPLEFKSLDLI